MKDRIPTKILSNGAIRYGVYDDTGTLLRYEYIKPEDEPTEQGDPLCKGTLLPDDVAASLGLTGNPQVANALETIGNLFSTLNIYRWDKFAYSINPATFSNYQNNSISLSAADVNSTNITINYATELNFLIAGVPALKSPITITDTISNIIAKYGTTLQGKYVCHPSENEIYYIYPTNSALNYQYPSGGGGYYLYANRATIYPNSWGLNYIKKTVYTPVSSTDPLKYPQSGAAGDYFYRYTGALHDFSTSNIVGSYTGTGVYGSTNKNTLNIDPKTRLVVIRPVSQQWNHFGIFIISGTSAGNNTIGFTPAFAYLSGTAVCALTATFDNGTLSWYNTSAQNQLNETQTYEYTCFC